MNPTAALRFVIPLLCCFDSVVTMALEEDSDYPEDNACGSFSYVTCAGGIATPVKMCKLMIHETKEYICQPCISSGRDPCPRQRRKTKVRRSKENQSFEEKLAPPLFFRHRRQAATEPWQPPNQERFNVDDRAEDIPNTDLPKECPVPDFLYTADLECELTRKSLVCRATCDPMFTYTEGRSRIYTCNFSENKWLPAGFEECIDRNLCRIKLHTQGTLSCANSMTMEHGPECRIDCSAQRDKPRVASTFYTCDTDGQWSPELPHCVSELHSNDTAPPDNSTTTELAVTKDLNICQIHLIARGLMSCEDSASTEQSLRCRISCDEWKDEPAVAPASYTCDTDGQWIPELPHCIKELNCKT